MTSRSPGGRAKPPRDEPRRSASVGFGRGCRRLARRFVSKLLEGLREPEFDIETGFQTAVVRAGGRARGSWRSPCMGRNRFVFRRGRAHVSVSRDKFGCGRRFLHFGVAVHVGFLAFERRSGLLDPLIGFAPAPPGDREAVVLQGRAERAGASRQPLAARPALAVAIFFSFPHR